MTGSAVHDVHMAINLVHRLVYFVPEAAEEYGKFGAAGAGGYFASRSAPMGAVTDDVVIATFYNFSPLAIRSAMPGMWDAASPTEWQQARFRAVDRALQRVGAQLPAEDIEEARALIDPVVNGLNIGGKPLAAGNAAVALPDDPMVALFQQITVVREWRGDAHIAVLVANEVAPCDCLVWSVSTGRFPLRIAQVTRRWTEDEWAAAQDRLRSHGWLDAEGAVTPAGAEERDRLEAETDRLCEPIWEPIDDDGARRLIELITPIHDAMQAAGTYGAFA
ncbi:MAG TPA: hypothetical protein VFE86_02835 [Ilumatobacteraceae bacterium]|nr:hypothetical protein [Ilumatobacteraceae bacterium]